MRFYYDSRERAAAYFVPRSAPSKHKKEKWRQLILSRGSASLLKVYYPTKWARVAGM